MPAKACRTQIFSGAGASSLSGLGVSPRDVTEAWLQTLDFQIFGQNQAPTIEGVVFRQLTTHLDGRGDVTELWSEPWDEFTVPAHVYQSATDFGVVKCWHLHQTHTDQSAVTRGKAQVTLVDLREESASFCHVNVLILGTQRPGLVLIPPGVMHGWKALSQPEVIVTNLQTHVYDAADEFKFRWNCVLEDVWQPQNG